MPVKEHHAPRKAFLAVTLSLLVPGLGQVYCGRLNRGLVLFFFSFAFGPVMVEAASGASSTAALAAVLGSIALLGLLFLYAAIDAFRLARRPPPEYQLKEYNKGYVYAIFIAFALTYPVSLATSIKNDIIQAFKIPSQSMVPNLLPGDYVLLNKMTYKKQTPQKGDVVIFSYPNDRRLDYMKRIVAMPGDTVEMQNNVLSINGIPVDHPAQGTTAPPSGHGNEVAFEEQFNGAAYTVLVDPMKAEGRDFPKTTVPNGSCFVLGDNRGNSVDSRVFGPVPLADVKGRVEYIYLPAGDLSRFGPFPRLRPAP